MTCRVRAPILLMALVVSSPALAETSEDEVQLLGRLSREQIEARLPDWVEAAVEAEPDLEVAQRLASAGYGVRVTVYLGTWCSDSRRELARLWRALDEAGGWTEFDLDYVGVARGLEEPADLVEGVDLRFVPTFVVRRDGVEMGRIVEESPRGIEVDLLALVDGERTGLLTARTDLGPDPDGRR